MIFAYAVFQQGQSDCNPAAGYVSDMFIVQYGGVICACFCGAQAATR